MVAEGEETKSSATDGEKSERLHSTGETGEPSQGTQRREGGRHITDPVEGKKARPSSSGTFLTGLDWVAEVARRRAEQPLTTLAQHITVDLLRAAYKRTRKDGATGVDGKTWKQYGQTLEDNLEDLHGRFRSGRYVAPPVRRAHIPKGGGKTRPIGIPTLEDKVLQRAVAMVLDAVYEQEFCDCSYGFRPGRSPHQALRKVWKGVMGMQGGTVIDVDIEGFFDNLDHGHLRAFLDTRVRDGVVRRTIDKWIKVGVLEGGQLRRSTKGTPQGGVISPLLANIYLHHVLDTWLERDVRPRLKGRSLLVRYADDFVIVCEEQEDARRVMDVLPKRFGRYGLTLHRQKTQQVSFRQPRDGDDDDDQPGSFAFLGFTHFWAKSRKGQWVVRQKTAKKSMRRIICMLREWLMRIRHWAVRDQHAALCAKIRGHDAYYGITGNAKALSRMRQYTARCWQQALNSRAQNRHMQWPRFRKLLEVYPLPARRMVQSVYRNAARP